MFIFPELEAIHRVMASKLGLPGMMWAYEQFVKARASGPGDLSMGSSNEQCVVRLHTIGLLRSH